MRLNSFLTERSNPVWDLQLATLVHDAIDYHVKNPMSEAGKLFRNYVAPMLSYAHQHPAEVEYPDDFQLGVNMVRSCFPNPDASTLKRAVEHLHKAMPSYHESHQGLV